MNEELWFVNHFGLCDKFPALSKSQTQKMNGFVNRLERLKVKVFVCESVFFILT